MYIYIYIYISVTISSNFSFISELLFGKVFESVVLLSAFLILIKSPVTSGAF